MNPTVYHQSDPEPDTTSLIDGYGVTWQANVAIPKGTPRWSTASWDGALSWDQLIIRRPLSEVPATKVGA